jgi:hypothetical protein
VAAAGRRGRVPQITLASLPKKHGVGRNAPELVCLLVVVV